MSQRTLTTTDQPAPTGHAVTAGALLAGVGVALGAFGAHALKARLSPEALAIFETGVRYQMYAGLGTLALSALPGQRRAPQLLVAGAVIFSGSLYLLAAGSPRWLGAVTPIGGALMIAGFGLAALDARRKV
jgi:uncharacterized membrane protein YgdD (TMEM256/DUF423 family)